MDDNPWAYIEILKSILFFGFNPAIEKVKNEYEKKLENYQNLILFYRTVDTSVRCDGCGSPYIDTGISIIHECPVCSSICFSDVCNETCLTKFLDVHSLPGSFQCCDTKLVIKRIVRTNEEFIEDVDQIMNMNNDNFDLFNTSKISRKYDVKF